MTIYPHQASPEHLLSAAIMSAPAALAMAKLSYPETEVSHTKTENDVYMEKTYVSSSPIFRGITKFCHLQSERKDEVTLCSRFFQPCTQCGRSCFQWRNRCHKSGGICSCQPHCYPRADWIFECHFVLSWRHSGFSTVDISGRHDHLLPAWEHKPILSRCISTVCFILINPRGIAPSLQLICYYVFWPLAAVMGVELEDAGKVASLLGTKVFVDEFISFMELGNMISAQEIKASVLNRKSIRTFFLQSVFFFTDLVVWTELADREIFFHHPLAGEIHSDRNVCLLWIRQHSGGWCVHWSSGVCCTPAKGWHFWSRSSRSYQWQFGWVFNCLHCW